MRSSLPRRPLALALYPAARSGRPGPRHAAPTITTSRARRSGTARPRPATISSSAGRSGSSGTSSERGALPIADPYSFRPEAQAPPNLQGWLLRDPRTGLSPVRSATCGPTTSSSGSRSSSPEASLRCGCARSGLRTGAALVGGVVFALAPYRVGQSTGHLLGLVSFLLPGHAAGTRATAPSPLRARAPCDPPVGAAPSRARGHPTRARLCLGATAALAVAEGGRDGPPGARRGRPDRGDRRVGVDRRRAGRSARSSATRRPSPTSSPGTPRPGSSGSRSSAG